MHAAPQVQGGTHLLPEGRAARLPSSRFQPGAVLRVWNRDTTRFQTGTQNACCTVSADLFCGLLGDCNCFALLLFKSHFFILFIWKYCITCIST